MKTTHCGKLYVFEGPDNVGKTTVAKYAAELLSKTGEYQYLSFPGNIPHSIGDLVYKIHHQKEAYGINEVDNTSLQALHIAAHIDVIKRVIIPMLRKGTSILLDRYWWSTHVYSEALGCDVAVVQHLIGAEKMAWLDISPEIIFLLKRGFPGGDNSNETRTLVKSYFELANKEMMKSNVVNICNTNLDESVSSVVEAINSASIAKAKIFVQKQASLLTQQNSNTKNDTPPPSSLDKLLAPSVVFNTYWEFAAKRQEIFFARLRGDKKPWTDDPILTDHKFTNAYRASDRVSQYLIKNVIYTGSQDSYEVFFRIILFKVFNKIETWKLLERSLGEISFSSFNFDLYDNILTKAINNDQRIYSAAYIMPTGGRGTKYKRKHHMHLDLIEKMMKDDLPLKVVNARSMGKVFELLRSYPGIGDFLAYQYATDLNYSELTNFSETQFVVPGPGARDGIKKCFTKTGGLSDAEIIKIVMEHQEEEFERLGLSFKSLWGRQLKLIDCQNLFCETDKYSRVKHPEIKGRTGRSRIKQKFHPNPQQIEYWYPPKWGINEMIQTGETP